MVTFEIRTKAMRFDLRFLENFNRYNSLRSISTSRNDQTLDSIIIGIRIMEFLFRTTAMFFHAAYTASLTYLPRVNIVRQERSRRIIMCKQCPFPLTCNSFFSKSLVVVYLVHFTRDNFQRNNNNNNYQVLLRM